MSLLARFDEQFEAAIGKALTSPNPWYD